MAERNGPVRKGPSFYTAIHDAFREGDAPLVEPRDSSPMPTHGTKTASLPRALLLCQGFEIGFAGYGSFPRYGAPPRTVHEDRGLAGTGARRRTAGSDASA